MEGFVCIVRQWEGTDVSQSPTALTLFSAANNACSLQCSWILVHAVMRQFYLILWDQSPNKYT